MISKPLFYLKIFLFIVIPSLCFAGPKIDSINGNFIQGNTIRIFGSQFGNKYPAEPWLYEDFESGAIDGATIKGRLTPIGNHSWKNYQAAGNGEACVYDDTQSFNGEYSAYQLDNTSATTDQNIFVEGQKAQKRYVSYRFRYAGSSDGIWKMDRTTSGTVKSPPYDSPPNFGWGAYIYHNNCDDFVNLGWISLPSANKWHRIETYFTLSTPDVSNGTLKVWFNKNNILDRDGDLLSVTSSCSVAQIDTWMSPLIANNTETIYTWIDDIYIDNTQSRVEVCNNNTFHNSTNCEIQIPTVWSKSSIDIIVNKGALESGQTAYLYVIDSQGLVNQDGYEIVIEENALSAPTGLRIVNSNN
jgi:hypothetical protein